MRLGNFISVATIILCAIAPVRAQTPVTANVPSCPSYTDASGTYQSDAPLFSAAPSTNPRRAMFVQCLAASCLFALNLKGGTASLTDGTSVVMNGQYSFFNAASFGAIPQKAVRIIASGSSVFNAWTCP